MNRRIGLWFWFGRGEFASFHLVLKSGAGVRAIAKRLVLGLAAAAQRNESTARQTELAALGIANIKIAFYADGAIAHDRDFSHGYFGAFGF
jgi:hypothetical protein